MDRLQRAGLVFILGLGIMTGYGCDSDNLVYSLATVSEVTVEILESDPPQVRVVVEGMLPSPCYHIPEERIEVSREGAVFQMTVYQAFDPEMICTQVLVKYRINVPLDIEGLPAGTCEVRVNDKIVTFELDGDN
jgi:hypothetical protein